MFNNQNNYEVEFRRGRYSNETFLIPNQFEHDVYTFELNRRSNVGISVFPRGGRVDLELYGDSNNNRRLDRNDRLIDRSSRSGDQFLNNRLAQGTYFTHVGLGRLDRGQNILEYVIGIDTTNGNNSRPPLLFQENTTNYEVRFRRGRYSNQTLLIPNQFEHDVYTFELNRRSNVDISVFPTGGRVRLELFRDSNNDGRLDRTDQFIDGSNVRGDQSLNNRLAQGTYFTHVGLGRLDRGQNSLEYVIGIDTTNSNNSRPPLLFEENTTNYEVRFRRGRYTNESFLIPDEAEHDIYTFELSQRSNVDINVSPEGGRVRLELFRDSNNDGRLDRTDQFIDGSNVRGDQSLNNRLAQGTYFTHIGLGRLDRGEDELDYEIEINTNSNNNSRATLLFEENAINYEAEFRQGRYTNESFLIPDEFEHDIYKIETSSSSSRISSLSEKIITPPDQLGKNSHTSSLIPTELTEDIYGLNSFCNCNNIIV